MRILTRRIVVALVVMGLTGVAVVSARQDPVSEVRKAMEATRRAEATKDAKAYDTLLADDLRWVAASDGSVTPKQERLKRVSDGNPDPPTYTEQDIKVTGDVATVVAVASFSDGARVRVARTFIKRDGRWQLLLHAGVRMQK